MVSAISRYNARTDGALQVRVGIATGSVAAGVIGKRMYIDDVWGEAVDLAARMESHGIAGRVQVSERTKTLLGSAFVVEPRAVSDLAGIGAGPTWLVNGAHKVTS
jgi:adenylate cyclase